MSKVRSTSTDAIPNLVSHYSIKYLRAGIYAFVGVWTFWVGADHEEHYDPENRFGIMNRLVWDILIIQTVVPLQFLEKHRIRLVSVSLGMCRDGEVEILHILKGNIFDR